MTLPEIVLPKIALPFDIPVLIHPFTAHFLVAIPVVILLLELMNLILKKKAVGGVSFFLLILTVLAAIAAYFTGLTDGKEAYPALNEAAKMELAEHKLLGTYLLLGSGVLLFLKLLAMTGNKVLKALYILPLIGFVVLMFNQGKEGGELVYEHGLNNQAVKALDEKIFDLEEELEECTDAAEKNKPIEVPVPTLEKSEPVKTPVSVPVVEETPEVKTIPEIPAIKEVTAAKVPDTMKAVETLRTKIEEKVSEVVPEMPAEMIQPKTVTY